MKLQQFITPTPKQNEMINQATALHQAGKLDEAEEQYKKLLISLPANTVLLTNLGTIALQKGNLEDAVRIIGQSLQISPNQPNALNNLGIALQALDRLDEAVANYDRAIVLDPNYVDAHFNRGNALKALNRPSEAVASYDRVIAINPSYAKAYFNRALVLRTLNCLDQAVASYDRAIEINPNYFEAYSNCGTVLQALKRLDEAVDRYDCAIAINPNFAEAYFNRGNALKDLNRLYEAVASYDEAIAINPNCAEFYYNRGKAIGSITDLDEAIASYDKAIAINPNYADAYWNKSLVKILKGEYEEGWQLYEWRWKTKAMISSLRTYPQPLWLGEQQLTNKALLIYPEQGLGDYIQFVRYAILVEKLGAKVILEVPSALMNITKSLKGQFIFIENGQPLPDFDYCCPVMSLPLAFNTRIETIPNQVPYLYSNTEKLRNWQQRLGEKTKLRVGLVWSGSTSHQNDHNRSIALGEFAPLLDLPMEFHCLQKEIREDDMAYMTGHAQIKNHQSLLKDFSDTAALVDLMDVVISVDTSVAHLAGALGKNVWILLPYTPDYRWMLGRADSPWYPTAKLFRQSKIDDWGSVIIQISHSLLYFSTIHLV